jgi:hypothetical protein
MKRKTTPSPRALDKNLDLKLVPQLVRDGCQCSHDLASNVAEVFGVMK